MGVFSRLQRVFRSEVSQLANYTSDKTEPLTFVSDLVTGEYTNKDEWRNLLKVAQEDPIAHRICVQLNRNVFDDWFVIHKRGAEEDEDPIHPKNEQIQEEFERMNAKYHVTQAAIGMSIFGHSALVFNMNTRKADVETDGYAVAQLDVFTDENMTIPQSSFNMDTTGDPDYIIVYPNASYKSITQEIPWEDVQWWCQNPRGRSIYGYSDLYAIWDLMTYLRESVDAMSWTHKKLGLGVWIWYLKGGLSTELKDAMEDTFKEMSSRRAIIASRDDFDDIKWEGPPSSATSAIVEGMDALLGLISSGSTIPKDIFTGVSAGAITGSEINNKALYATISRKQSDYTPYILDLIERMGYDISDMVIEWNTRYATDELEQAQIELLKAQAEALLNPPAQKYQIGPESQKNQEQNNNPGGLQS